MTPERRAFWLRHFARQLLAESGQNMPRNRFSQFIEISRDAQKNAKMARLMGADWLVQVNQKVGEMRRARRG